MNNLSKKNLIMVPLITVVKKLISKNTWQNVSFFGKDSKCSAPLFFKQLPLIGNKGEMLVIKAPKLNLSYIIKSRIFVVPFGMDYFLVGETFEWEDKTLKPSFKAKKWLEKYLKKIISVPYEVVFRLAGIRPTVTDRKPLLGRHHNYQNLFVFNGLVTRVSLMAPLLSERLFKFFHENIPLPEQIDISRFKKKPDSSR